MIDGSEKCNRQKCRIEWNFVKELDVREYYPVGHITELWKMLATHHSDEVQSLIKLCEVALVLPTNTAGCVKEVLAHKIELRMLWETDWKLRGWMCPWLLTLRGHLSRTLTFLQPLMFGREPTEELIQIRLPVIKRAIEVYKGMPGRDSAVKYFEV